MLIGNKTITEARNGSKIEGILGEPGLFVFPCSCSLEYERSLGIRVIGKGRLPNTNGPATVTLTFRTESAKIVDYGDSKALVIDWDSISAPLEMEAGDA